MTLSLFRWNRQLSGRADCVATQAERRSAEKCSDYFAAGALAVWDVDLRSDDVVKVYREPLSVSIDKYSLLVVEPAR